MQKPVMKRNRPTQLLSKVESGVHHILDALPFAALLVNPDHQIVAANKTMTRDYGVNEGDLIGDYCQHLMHQSNEPIDECPLVEALEKGKAIEREIYDSERARWMNAAVYPTRLVAGDGKPLFLHFIRDVTELKTATTELSRSLEHHKALYNLLQGFQDCRDCAQILGVLIDEVISLSWLGMEASAVGFLLNGKDLELTVARNVAPALLERCGRLAPGECLCGRTAETGLTIVCSSKSHDHDIKYAGMPEHQHVVLPIKHKGQMLGVLTLYLKPGDEIDDFRLGFLEAAVAAAGAVLAAQLARDEILRTQEKYIARVISSREDERKRVAYDLHDQLCQSLSAILLEMQSNSRENSAAESGWLSLEIKIRSLIDQVREMAGQLRPAILDDYGLKSALARKAKDLSGLKGMEIDYQSVSSVENKQRLPPAVEVGLYRVAMEALDNAVLHASASRVSVILLWQEQKLTLLVEDNGRGFDYPAVRRDLDHCQGIMEMEERMVVLGGTLRIESAPEKGTTVRAEVPVPIDAPGDLNGL